MARKAVTIPTSLYWVFLMLAGIILLILMSRGWISVGNEALSVMEELKKLWEMKTS